jgi:hypothetical protein
MTLPIMELNLTQITIWGLGIACACFGWFARQVWGAVQGLKDDLSNLREELGKEYVRYDRLKDAFEPVMESLREIKHTLAGKADK